MSNTPPYDIPTIKTWLEGCRVFLNVYTRQTYPYLLNSFDTVRNNFHTVEGRRGYLISEASTSEGQAVAIEASFRAKRATGVADWGVKGLAYANAYVNYFFVETTPPTVIDEETLWIAHWATNTATYAIPGKGAQGTDRAFNFGNFNNTVSFVNGVGTLPANVADVYKVYSIDGSLQYENVYAPLLEGTEYTLSYWVQNYRLEGTNYQTDASGNRTLTAASAGTIVLDGTFTGDAIVVYSHWIPDNIPGLAKFEPYPMWHPPERDGYPTYLGYAVDSGWWGYSAFKEVHEDTGDSFWLNAANATRQTMINAAVVENPSFYYKKDESTNLFVNPGSQLVQANNINGYTATRVTSAGMFQYFMRLDVAAAPVGNFPTIEVQNYVIQTIIGTTVSVYTELAANTTQVIEVALSLSQDPIDITQEYKAYWLVDGNSQVQLSNFLYNNFVKFNAGTVWHPLIADTPLFTYSGDGGSINYDYEQATVALANPVVVAVTLEKGGGIGFAGAGLNNASYGTQPPNIRYASTVPVRMRVTDSNDEYWFATLDSTVGAWQTFSASWTSLSSDAVSPGTGNIQEIVFEAIAEEAGNFKLYYVGDAPEVIAVGAVAYKALLRSRVKSEQTLWVGDFRPVNNVNDKLTYNPGAVPFTINVLSDGLGGFTKDGFGGPPYAGYLSSYHWHIWGYPTRVQQSLQFLSDSQDAYLAQSAVGLKAPLMQVFLWKYWDTADFRTYGSTGDEWSWNGADPNTAWFPYCARPMEATARYLLANPNDTLAKKILNFYFIWIQQFLISSGNKPPTDIPPVTSPEANYEEPHAAALIMRAATYANVAGLLPAVTLDIIERCYNYLDSKYIGSGIMSGSFTAAQPEFIESGTTYREYFAFWHFEIISSLSELINYQNNLTYPADSLLAQAGVFPSLTPNRIETIALPPFKTNRNLFDDGNEQRLRLAHSGVSTQMTLAYELKNASEFKVFVDFWRLSKGSLIPFTLPSSILNHPDAFLLAFANLGSITYWRFSESFDINTEYATVENGLYNFTIKIQSVVN